ncbi:hypothetical protein F4804DRAFT_9582 [Jackrogersella minutella]|nr:hypothetical protein F4804DRAFT_9582 [Jackrogersella minutella]
MGNIFGKPQIFFVSYEPSPSSSPYSYGDSDDYTSDDGSYAPYGWGQFASDLCCCPWFGGYPGQEPDDSWNGAIVGIVRRKGCKNQDHWALAFRPDVDVSQLPRRLNGFRTHVPTRCRRTCPYRRRVYIVTNMSSSYDDSSMVADQDVVE